MGDNTFNDAREKGIRAVIVSPQHSTHQAEAIAGDIGAEIITLDPLARDYTANLRQAADELARALSRD